METERSRREVNGKRQYDEAANTKPLKRPKLLSAIGTVRVNGATVEAIQPKQSHSTSIEKVDVIVDPETLNPVVQDVYKRPEAVQRNKRLFGSLMGHLSLAKKKLEEDSTQIEKQVALQSAVVQRVSEENRRLEELHKEAFGAQKTKETALKSILALKQKKADVQLLSEVRKKQFKPLSEFILTEALPKLCWAPVTHNDVTTEKLCKRREEIASLLAKGEQEDEREIAAIDEELQQLEAVVAEVNAKIQVQGSTDGTHSDSVNAVANCADAAGGNAEGEEQLEENAASTNHDTHSAPMPATASAPSSSSSSSAKPLSSMTVAEYAAHIKKRRSEVKNDRNSGRPLPLSESLSGRLGPADFRSGSVSMAESGNGFEEGKRGTNARKAKSNGKSTAAEEGEVDGEEEEGEAEELEAEEASNTAVARHGKQEQAGGGAGNVVEEDPEEDVDTEDADADADAEALLAAVGGQGKR